jgi:Leucine-rich repeat (LRR) protein
LEEYLEKNYSGKQKNEITGALYIDNKNLEGDLKIEGFTNLERLDCYSNKLASLKIINCPKLKTLYCYSNQLHSLELDDLPQLELLSCHSNNLPKQDLTIFSNFTNLTTLRIGNNDKEQVEKDIYNRFSGSLESLKDLNKLSELNISNTDIDSGLEFLPDSVGTLEREVISDESNKYNFGVNEIRKQLTPCGNSIST